MRHDDLIVNLFSPNSVAKHSFSDNIFLDNLKLMSQNEEN